MLYHTMDKIKLKPRVRQADSFNDSKATSVKGSYHIGAWDIVSSENPASISLSHPRFEDITFTGSEAQEVFSEVSAIAQANGCSAEDAWRHFLSRYLVLDSVRGKKSSSLGASTKMSRMQHRTMDSVDDSAKVYTTRFHALEQAFATGIPAGYKFIGTGVAFMPDTHKRAHTVDFRNTNLDEDAEDATIEVPYDANTGTIAKVKADLADIVSKSSTSSQGRLSAVADASDISVASLQDVINLGITYNLVPRILILSDSVGFVSAVNLPNGDRLPYSVLLSFKGAPVDASTAKANKRDLKVSQVFMQLETTSGRVISKWESVPDIIFDLTQVEDLLILFRSVSENCTSLDEVLSQLQSSLSTSFVKSK